MLTKQKTLLGRGARAEGSRVNEGNLGALLCHMACSLRFYRNGINFWVVSGQSSCLAHSWSGSGPSWQDLSAKMDLSAKDSGRLVVFSLLLAPSKFSWLVFRAAPCSLSGPPVVRQLMQVAITVPGQGGWFHHWSPNISAINGAGILWKPGRETPLSSLGVREGGEGSKER